MEQVLAGYRQDAPLHRGRPRDLTDVQAVQNLDDLLADRRERVDDVSRRLESVAGLEVGPVLGGAPYEPFFAALLTWTSQAWSGWRPRSVPRADDPGSGSEPVDGFLTDLALLLAELVLSRRPELAWTVNLYPFGVSGMVDERAPAVRLPPVGEMRYPHWFHATGLVRGRFRHASWTTAVLPDDWRRAVDDCVLGAAEEFWLLAPLTPNRQFSAAELAPPDEDAEHLEDLDDDLEDLDDAEESFAPDWNSATLADLPDHRVTLMLRHDRAHGEGFDGSASATASALSLVLADQTRVLGPEHPDTLVTRYNIAFWRRRAGEAGAAVAELSALEPELAAGLGSTSPIARAARLQLSRWHAALGAPDAAVEVLRCAVDVPGLDPVHRLTLRHDLAHWTGVAGDSPAARSMFAELLPDYVALLGESHFYTRNAGWTAELWSRA